MLGAAVAIPAVCLYLGKRMREKATSVKMQPPERRKTTGAPEPVRIPVRGESTVAVAEEPSTLEPEAPPVELPEDRAVSAPTAETQDQRPLFVASTESNKFHKPGCRWAGQIRDDHRVAFDVRADALEAGYEPCASCRP
jgi:hypothetical protein